MKSKVFPAFVCFALLVGCFYVASLAALRFTEVGIKIREAEIQDAAFQVLQQQYLMVQQQNMILKSMLKGQHNEPTPATPGCPANPGRDRGAVHSPRQAARLL